MKVYTYVPVLSGGSALPEVVVNAETPREANRKVWNTLTDAQRAMCEYLDWVDTQEVAG
jgi:hypothetical protein